ncbi:hypothetical protein LSUE1_G003929, partial [Lachnellula suecica]
MHSAGGFIGSGTVEGLGLEARSKQGKKGGVRKLVFSATGVFPEESMIQPMLFFEHYGGRLWCKDTKPYLFNDRSG